jgi:hypothetical protein
MNYGSSWSEAFINDLEDKEFRDEFVADQTRTRIALLIRALREQEERNWSQAELGQQMGGKPQSVISRLEDPDYGKLSLQTLLEAAAAFGLPLWIDMPEWEDWLARIRDVPNSKTKRRTFDAERLKKLARSSRTFVETGSQASGRVVELSDFRRIEGQNESIRQSAFAKATAAGFGGAYFSVSVA